MNYRKTLEEELKACEDNLDLFEEQIRKTNESFDRQDIQPCIEHEQGYYDGLTFALRESKKRIEPKTIIRIIRIFVRKKYGESELNNQSWNIKALAIEIANKL